MTAAGNSLKLAAMSHKLLGMRPRLAVTIWLLFHLCPGLNAQEGQPEFLVRSGPSGTKGGTLVAAINADISTFNRMLTAGMANAMVADRLSGDLVHINRRTLELEPSLASRWEAAADGKTYTIHLRRGLRFSDGSPFTADDVLFSFQVLQDPASAADQAGQVQIDGAFPSVTKIDDHTVKLEFPRPVGMGLRALDSIPMLPRHRLMDAFRQGNLRSAWGPGVDPEQVAGMGPFRLKEYRRGIHVILERNPYYWKRDESGQALPYLDRIVFLVIQDRNAEALRFQAGELDVASSLSPENFALLRRSQPRGNYQLKDLGPGLGMEFLWLNLNPGKKPSGEPYMDPEKLRLFQRVEFRQAVSCALDREAMKRSVFLGLGEPQSGPISTGNKAWRHPALRPAIYDPARARELLARIGLRDRDGDGILEYGSRPAPLEIDLLSSRGNLAREKMAQIIKENFARAGIRANVQLLLANEIATRFMETFDYEAILFGLIPTDVVPDLQTDLWYSSGRLHFWYPAQPRPHYPWEATLDELTSRLVRALDPRARRELCNRMQELWVQEMPAIPIIAPNVIVGWKSTVGNVSPSTLVPHLLWNAEELTVSRK
ncbi:MAG: ABC transporter substrate-binding protein [Kiritimatiellia bacterium]